jgi:acetyl esterase/lipase
MTRSVEMSQKTFALALLMSATSFALIDAHEWLTLCNEGEQAERLLPCTNNAHYWPPEYDDIGSRVSRWLGLCSTLAGHLHFYARELPPIAAERACRYWHRRESMQGVQLNVGGAAQCDLFLSDATATATTLEKKKRMVFVYGGSWGSGSTSLYFGWAKRFQVQGYDVALIGYRTWPEVCVEEMLFDLIASLAFVLRRCFDGGGDDDDDDDVVFVGHSAGGHLLALMFTWLVYAAAGRALPCQRCEQRLSAALERDGALLVSRCRMFVPLVAPLDVADHWHWEAKRGVDRLSPMTRAFHGNRASLAAHSPTRLLRALVAVGDGQQRCDASTIAKALPPSIVVVASRADQTVPLASSARFARALRALNATSVSLRLHETLGHGEFVLPFMYAHETRAREQIVELFETLHC